jgi:hypothetical protein
MGGTPISINLTMRTNPFIGIGGARPLGAPRRTDGPAVRPYQDAKIRSRAGYSTCRHAYGKLTLMDKMPMPHCPTVNREKRPVDEAKGRKIRQKSLRIGSLPGSTGLRDPASWPDVAEFSGSRGCPAMA